MVYFGFQYSTLLYLPAWFGRINCCYWPSICISWFFSKKTLNLSLIYKFLLNSPQNTQPKTIGNYESNFNFCDSIFINKIVHEFCWKMSCSFFKCLIWSLIHILQWKQLWTSRLQSFPGSFTSEVYLEVIYIHVGMWIGLCVYNLFQLLFLSCPS